MTRSRYDESGFRHTYGPIWTYASQQPCVVCGRIDGTPADHITTVGTGGRDEDNCLPVCSRHQDRHNKGLDTWLECYGLTRDEIRRVAEEVTSEWRQYYGG